MDNANEKVVIFDIYDKMCDYTEGLDNSYDSMKSVLPSNGDDCLTGDETFYPHDIKKPRKDFVNKPSCSKSEPLEFDPPVNNSNGIPWDLTVDPIKRDSNGKIVGFLNSMRNINDKYEYKPVVEDDGVPKSKPFAKGCSRLKRLTATPKNFVPPKRYIQPGDLPDGRYKILDDFVENARMQRSLTLDYYEPTQTWLPKMCFVPNVSLKGRTLVKESQRDNVFKKHRFGVNFCIGFE